jgi:hypothetical protein
MKQTKQLMFGSAIGITVLAALILLAGCPQPGNTDGEEPSYTISGMVKDDDSGDPLSGVEVKLLKDDKLLGDPVTTGDDGKYSFTGVTAGEDYTLTASKNDYTPYTGEKFTVSGDKTIIAIRLSKLPRYNVKGRVFLIDDEHPADKASVQLYQNGAAYDNPVTTGEEGQYTITYIPAGTYTITAAADEYEYTGAPITVEVSDNVTGKNIILTQCTYTVSGIISLDHPSGKANGAEVQVYKGGQGLDGLKADIGADGAYLIPGLVKGNYTLMAQLTGYQIFLTPEFEVSKTAGNKTLDITLLKTDHPVSGTITTIPPVDTTQASVALYRLDTKIGNPIHPDAQGSFSFPTVDARTTDDYVIKVSLDGYEPYETPSFPVTGPVILPLIEMRPPLPVPSVMLSNQADELKLMFSRGVAISGTTGLTLEVIPASAPALTIEGITRIDDTEWVLTLNREIDSTETVTLKYDNAAETIKEFGGEQRAVASFEKTAVEPLTITLAQGLFLGSFIRMLTITFNKDCDLTPSSYAGWTLTGSDSGVLNWDITIPPDWTQSASTTVFRASASPNSTETLTLTYNKAAAGANKLVANDGTELADCSITVTRI